MRNFATFSTPLAFELPAFRNAARYLKAKPNSLNGNDGCTSSPNLVQFVSRIPENHLKIWAPLKIGQQKCAKSSITQQRMFDFTQIYYGLWSCDTRCATQIQGQGVEGQGHSVT